MEGREALIYFSLKYKGDFLNILHALQTHEQIDDDEVIPKMDCKAITMLDENYPKDFYGCCHPPIVLYYYGDISLINNYEKNLSVIGTRHPTSYGTSATKKILDQVLEEDVVIVSGLAKGIDAYSQELALSKKRKTIAILGSGIDICYPSCNQELYERIKKEGLVISEYPPGVEPSPDKFPFRNRLIAALSKTLLITEAHYHSGTSITAGFALSFGRDICCVPRNIGQSSLCNRLINEGAFLVEDGEDVLYIMKKGKSEPIFEL